MVDVRLGGKRWCRTRNAFSVLDRNGDVAWMSAVLVIQAGLESHRRCGSDK